MPTSPGIAQPRSIVFALALVLLAVGSPVAGSATAAGQESPAVSPDPFVELQPPLVEGIEWLPLREVRGVDIMATFEGAELEDWLLLLEAMDATPEQLAGVDVRAAFPAAPDEAGGFSAIRITGVDEERFRDELLTWIETRRGVGPMEAERVSIAGRDVDVLTLSIVQQGHLYVAGDTAYAIFVPPEYVRDIIVALPEEPPD